MEIRKNWDALNARMKEENKECIAGLFQIHMGAFDDLRKSGHLIKANGQPASVLAAKLDPQERFSLACQIGNSLVEKKTGIVGGSMAETFGIRMADDFPNCIAIALGATLESIHPGLPGKKTPVLFTYDTCQGNGGPLGKALQALEPCFPWAEFKVNTVLKEPPKPMGTPVLPLDRMDVLFKADGVTKIAPGRTSFSGTVVRGTVRKGDVLTVTDAAGRQVYPQCLVMELYLKDRVEDGKVTGEKAEAASAGQHIDSLLVSAEIPAGTYNGFMLCREQEQAPAASAQAEGKPAAGEKAPKPEKKGFLAGLFKKRG